MCLCVCVCVFSTEEQKHIANITGRETDFKIFKNL